MNTTGILELLDKVAPLIPDGVTDMADHLTLRSRVADLIAEVERLRAALLFIRDKEQAALNEAESLLFNIPEDAGCMEILHAARKALEQT